MHGHICIYVCCCFFLLLVSCFSVRSLPGVRFRVRARAHSLARLLAHRHKHEIQPFVYSPVRNDVIRALNVCMDFFLLSVGAADGEEACNK